MKFDDSIIQLNETAAAAVESSSVKKPRKETRDAEGSIIKRVEEKRTSNGKTRKVTVFYARVRYRDNEGKKREKKRQCDSYNDAVIKRRQLRNEIEEELNPPPVEDTPDVKTFNEVLDIFEEDFVKEAVYHEGEKTEGYKEDLENVRYQIKLFREFFGTKLVTEITYDDILDYKIKRLATQVETVYYERRLITEDERAAGNFNPRQKYIRIRKTKTNPRKFASVHRELSRLRRIFNIAIRKSFITINPFSLGESLIKQSVETVRLRICTVEEEKRLLAACCDRRTHLKAILVFALDTAMRAGEIFKLCWKDVYIDERRIYVQATNAKTDKPRWVPMTGRVVQHLEILRSDEATPEDLVFGITTKPKTSWKNVLIETGIEDLRFHDLRATGITRMLRAGIPEAEVMKISGHSDYKTFLKYVRQDVYGAQTAADKMNSYLEQLQTEEPNGTINSLGARAP